MSHTENYQDTGRTTAFYQGVEAERERIIRGLESYFELAQEPNEDGTANDNPEWDNGFQAAMALIKGEHK